MKLAELALDLDHLASADQTDDEVSEADWASLIATAEDYWSR